MIHAIREARRRSRSTRPTSEAGFCKREVRECYGIAVSRSADAAQAWANAQHKHHETDPGAIPRGVPVFWLGGSGGHGHISIGIGNGGHWTTDLLRTGFFDRTGIRLVSRKWTSLRLVGWTEDLDGVRVWRDGKPVALASRPTGLTGLVPAPGESVLEDLDDIEVPEVRGEVLDPRGEQA